jgi:hypothetical protein
VYPGLVTPPDTRQAYGVDATLLKKRLEAHPRKCLSIYELALGSCVLPEWRSPTSEAEYFGVSNGLLFCISRHMAFAQKIKVR